jgi:S1-C subfamily serine protease
VVVAGVEPGTRAWQSGLRPGDVIASVNHQRVSSLKEFLAAVDRKTEPLLLRIVRGNAAAFLVIK